MSGRDLGLLLRTVRHVPPRQVGHRMRLRAQRAWYASRPGDSLGHRWATAAPSGGAVGWPDGFVPTARLAGHDGPSAGDVFHLIGEQLDPIRDGWRPPDRSQLFRYHLHYFDWAWGLLERPDGGDAFARLWRSWSSDTAVGRWDEWSPYVVSLRAWNLCALHGPLIAGTPVAGQVEDSLAAAFGFLQRNLELDVGGNHLVKNLKALLGLAVFFGDRQQMQQTFDRLLDQLDIQVLDDGGHFELSPGYHVQVLADLVDVADLGRAVGFPGDGVQGGGVQGGGVQGGGADGDRLDATITAMAVWLRSISFPDGSVPLLGDTVPQPPALLDHLRLEHRQRLAPADAAPSVPGVTHLAESGYVVVRPRDGVMAVFDFGRPCPVELPAHAQADWGTFELWIDGERVVVDPGVSAYVGDRRAWERSTLAHNTLCIEGRNQTEVWGSFRAARRAVPGAVRIEKEARISADLVTFDGRRQQRTVAIHSDRLVIEDRAEPMAFGCTSLTVPEHHADRMSAAPGQPVQRTAVEVGEDFGRRRPAVRLQQQAIGSQSVVWTIDLRPS